MLTVKGENEREKCVISIQLELVASGMDRLFLWRTENTQLITRVPGMSRWEGHGVQRSGRVMKCVPPIDAGFLRVAETAQAPCMAQEMMKRIPTPRTVIGKHRIDK